MPYVNGVWIRDAAPKTSRTVDHAAEARADAARAGTRHSVTTEGRQQGEAYADHRRDVNNFLANGWPPSPPPGSPPGGSRGRSRWGGGGGGGGMSAAASAQKQIDTLMQLMPHLKSPERTFEPNRRMRMTISNAADRDENKANATMDSLDEYIAGLGNAYAAAPRAEAADVSGQVDLQGLLNSQGASGGAGQLAAEQAYLQSQAGNGAAAINRYQDSLRGMVDEENASRGVEAKHARSEALEDIGALRTGLDAQRVAADDRRRMQIEDQNFQQRLADRQAMMQLFAQLSQLAAQGGKMPAGMDIGTLLGGL